MIEIDGDGLASKPSLTRKGALERAVEHLQTLIDLRRIMPGETLPSASVLAEELQINRATVLEALHVLEREGLITLRPGPGGSRVTKCDDRPREKRRARAMSRIDQLKDVIVLREILDSGIARRVATSGLPSRTLRRARKIVEELKTVEDRDRYMALDTEFHELLAEATGSSVPKTLTNSLRQIFVVGLDAADLEKAYLHRSNQEHEKILDAIERGDPSKAAEWANIHVGAATSVINECLGLPSSDGNGSMQRSVNSKRKATRKEKYAIGY